MFMNVNNIHVNSFKDTFLNVKIYTMTSLQQSVPMCNSWHYEGDVNWFKCEYGKDFIQLCKEKLPNKSLPITIGRTGYIHLTELIPKDTYVWCEDDVGRFVCVIDDILVFQRMQQGHLLMYGRINSINSTFSDQATSDIVESLSSKLNQHF